MFRRLKDYYYLNIKSYKEREPITIATNMMIGLLVCRILSIVYTTQIIQIHAGRYGLYQMPVMYPFYVMFIVLCLIFINKRYIYNINMVAFLIFILVIMGLDIYFYINAIDPTSPF